MHDPYVWLVDSGASRTVVSIEVLSAYRVLRERNLTSPIHFRTASGEEVHIGHECMLEVLFPTIVEFDDQEKSKLARYEIRAVVGPVEHNLLSVFSLTRLGATFEYGPDGCHIRIGDMRRMDCEIWANVPWLRAHRKKNRGRDQDVEMGSSLGRLSEAWSESDSSPKKGSEDPSNLPKASVRGPFRLSPETTVRSPSKTQHAKVLKFNDQPEVQTFEIAVHEPNTDLRCPNESSVLHMLDQPLPAPGELDIDDSEGPESSSGDASFQNFSRKIEIELTLHRRRGHLPFDRRCSHCARSRSTIHHGRTKEGDSSPQDHKLLLVQADFFFVGVANYKYLLLTDAGTGLIGVAPCGMNVDHTLAECRRYFQQLGVSEQSPMNIEVLTDSERALGTLLKKLGLPLVIKTAAPQSHQSVGLAKRSVRRMKEMLSCLRSDLRSHGFDIVERVKKVLERCSNTSPKRTTTLV